MNQRHVVSSLVILTLAAGLVAADTRVVKLSRTDPIPTLGNAGKAREEQSTYWIGEDRMNLEKAGTSIIVRLDTMKMFIANHQTRTYSALDLPLDVSALLPPGIGEQMLAMMEFDAMVTPTDEWRTIDGRKARLYTITMISSMASMESKVWATTEVDFDAEAFRKLSEQTLLLQPGMKKLAAEMAKIEGFQLENESVMTVTAMPDTPMGTSENTLSIDEAAAPAGIYDPPEGYTEKPFDFASLMQK